MNVIEVVHEPDLTHIGFKLIVKTTSLKFLVQNEADFVLKIKRALD